MHPTRFNVIRAKETNKASTRPKAILFSKLLLLLFVLDHCSVLVFNLFCPGLPVGFAALDHQNFGLILAPSAEQFFLLGVLRSASPLLVGRALFRCAGLVAVAANHMIAPAASVLLSLQCALLGASDTIPLSLWWNVLPAYHAMHLRSAVVVLSHSLSIRLTKNSVRGFALSLRSIVNAHSITFASLCITPAAWSASIATFAELSQSIRALGPSTT